MRAVALICVNAILIIQEFVVTSPSFVLTTQL